MSEVFNTIPEFIPLALPPVPCRFCGKDAIYSPIRAMENYEINIFFCHPCQTEYLYTEDQKLWSNSIYTDVNGKKYRWTDFGGRYTLYCILKPGIPGHSVNVGISWVAHFNREDAVGITPTNLADKIKTWLPFL